MKLTLPQLLGTRIVFAHEIATFISMLALDSNLIQCASHYSHVSNEYQLCSRSPEGSPCTGSTPSSSMHVWWMDLGSMASVELSAPHRLVSDLADPPFIVCLLLDTSLTMPSLPSGPCTSVSWTFIRPTTQSSMTFCGAACARLESAPACWRPSRPFVLLVHQR